VNGQHLKKNGNGRYILSQKGCIIPNREGGGKKRRKTTEGVRNLGRGSSEKTDTPKERVTVSKGQI